MSLQGTYLKNIKPESEGQKRDGAQKNDEDICLLLCMLINFMLI